MFHRRNFEIVDWTQVRMRAMVGASEVLSGAETVFDTPDASIARHGL
jgi:hypothetical protein